MDPTDFWVWYEYGREQGWVSEITCHTHDGPVMSDIEVDAWGEGYDPCIPIIRLYEHPEDV